MAHMSADEWYSMDNFGPQEQPCGPKEFTAIREGMAVKGLVVVLEDGLRRAAAVPYDRDRERWLPGDLAAIVAKAAACLVSGNIRDYDRLTWCVDEAITNAPGAGAVVSVRLLGGYAALKYGDLRTAKQHFSAVLRDDPGKLLQGIKEALSGHASTEVWQRLGDSLAFNGETFRLELKV